MNPLFAIFGLGAAEIAVLGVIGVLLFGRKLPEMGKYLGKSIIEFKKGMRGLEENMDDGAGSSMPASQPMPQDAIRAPQRVAATAPKFEDSPTNTHVTSNPPQG